MITDAYELQEKLEELRRDTLPLIWEPVVSATLPSSSPVEELERLLILISHSKNKKLIREAEKVLSNILDFDVDCNPTVTVSL